MFKMLNKSCSVLCMDGFHQVALVVKNLPDNTGDLRDLSSNPGLGRSPGGENGKPLQHSGLEKSMDRGA